MCTAGGMQFGKSYYGKWCGVFLKKLEIEPSYDPAISLLGIHREDSPKKNAISNRYLDFNVYCGFIHNG